MIGTGQRADWVKRKHTSPGDGKSGRIASRGWKQALAPVVSSSIIIITCTCIQISIGPDLQTKSRSEDQYISPINLKYIFASIYTDYQLSQEF